MPSCKNIAEHTSDYLDHHMSLRKRLAFMLHIFICVHCRRYAQQLKLTIATIKKTPAAAVPDVSQQQVDDIVKHLRQHVGENSPHS